MVYELLFYAGVGVCVASAVGAVIAAIILWVSRARLKKTLDNEYGKRSR